MASPPPPLLDLASLGRSLDQARRARCDRSRTDSEIQPPDALDEAGHGLEAVRGIESDPGVESAGAMEVDNAEIADVERPYPLCLLCLARPPSAVLLPCCHLNLCHLCAPLLLHRAGATASSPDSTSNTSRPAQTYTLLPHPLAPPHARQASWSDTAESLSLSPSSDTIDTPPSPMIALEDGWDVPIQTPTSASSETAEIESDDALRLDLGPGRDNSVRLGLDGSSANSEHPRAPDTYPPQTPSPSQSQSQFQSQTQSQIRSQIPAQSHPEGPDPVSIVDADSPRTPWTTLLLRATAGNPKSRRLALGGYVAPPRSLRGGEMDGGDVLPPIRKQATGDAEHRQAVLPHLGQGMVVDVDEELARREQEERLGFSSSWARIQARNETETSATRRVVLSPRSGLVGNKHGARCLVCRADVEGWLRVYTG